jgi:lipid-A-disaccharide synthase
MTAVPSSAPPRPLSIAIIAAEESGDALGAALAQALRRHERGAIELSGVGGRAMAAVGIVSPFAIDELSIVGLLAILEKLPAMYRRIHDTAQAVVTARPDALVIVDSPEFTHRVARRVRARAPAIPIIDYVSPSVWAWRSGRARAMRAYVDHVLAILPFEPAVHQRLGGPPCTYVGHPLIERIAELRPSAEEARRRQADPPVILALPGSRHGEIRRLLDIFGATIGRLASRVGPLEVVLPTVPHLLQRVTEGVARWSVAPRIVVDPAEKWAAFRTARAALAASGTVTLELALSGVPMVAAYRLHVIEAVIARLFRIQAGLPSVILANLVIGENVVPELLQEDCTPEKLTAALAPLISDTPERLRQTEAFDRLDQIMGIGRFASSANAADIVLEAARHGRGAVATKPTTDPVTGAEWR